MSERELKPGDVWGDPGNTAGWENVSEDGQTTLMFGIDGASRPNINQSDMNITAALAKAQADAAALERVRAELDRWKLEADALRKRSGFYDSYFADELDRRRESIQRAIEGGA